MTARISICVGALIFGGMTLIACGGDKGTEPPAHVGGGGAATTSTSATGGDTGTDTTGNTGTGGNTGGTNTGGNNTGGTSTGGNNTGGTGGTTTTFTNTCAALPPVSYDACTGNTFFPDGSCQDGSCATVELEKRVFAEWKKQTAALSGLSAADMDSRVRISMISNKAGANTVFIRIDYVVVVDWVRSRQNISASFAPDALVNPPTDAQVKSAVMFDIEPAEWTSLGAIASAATESQVQDGFAQCGCDFKIDPCGFKFQNVTGKLTATGYRVIDANQNQCARGEVNLASGALELCIEEPCAIN